MKYVILSINEATDDMLRSANCPDLSSARKSVDGTKCILKFEMKDHAAFLGLTWFTHEEIKAIVSGSEWNPEAPSFLNKTLSFMGFK